jgi:hypothetical protein
MIRSNEMAPIKVVGLLAGAVVELKVIEPIYSSKTSIRSSRVMILGVNAYDGAAVLDESY